MIFVNQLQPTSVLIYQLPVFHKTCEIEEKENIYMHLSLTRYIFDT